MRAQKRKLQVLQIGEELQLQGVEEAVGTYCCV